MKKRIVMTTACAAAALALLGTGTVFAAGNIAEQSSIGAGNAINFAFADAGIDPVSATDVEAEFDYEQGQFIYDVEFTANNTEYDYWIKASSGAVVKKDVKLLPGAEIAAKEEKKEEEKQETKTEVKQITLEEAKNKALADAGLKAAEVTFTKEKADTEDGVLVYEVEFFKDNVEYEIDAVSGSIRSKSKETETVVQSQPKQPSQPKQETKTEVKKETKAEAKQPKQETKTEVKQPAQPAAPTTISVDKAKETATGHAGLKVADVTFSKAKLDNDDGRLEYEIEFFRDGVEYEYTIDAASGSILEWESERQEVDDDWDDDDDDDDYDDDHDDDDHDDDDDDDDD